jgi:hypothetical protein
MKKHSVSKDKLTGNGGIIADIPSEANLTGEIRVADIGQMN